MNVNWIGPTILRYGSEAQRASTCRASRAATSSGVRGSRSRTPAPTSSALRTRARPRRRRLRDRRQQDLDLVREPRRLLLPARAERPGVRAPARPLGAARADGPPGHRGARDPVGRRRALLPRGPLPRRARCPAAARLGPEGEGWDVVSLRAPVRARRRAALRARRAHARPARPRLRAGRRARRPGAAARLGEARALCEAARLLSYRVVDQRAHGEAPSADTNVARVAGTLRRAVGRRPRPRARRAPRASRPGASPTPSSAWR